MERHRLSTGALCIGHVVFSATRQSESSGVVRGWMTRAEIFDLNKLPRDMPEDQAEQTLADLLRECVELHE
eukprot:13582279-Alexandrium_andersonii.AAC.1